MQNLNKGIFLYKQGSSKYSLTLFWKKQSQRTPADKVVNLPPLGFRFQYARKIELEILHISVYLILILYYVEKIFQGHFDLGVYESYIDFWCSGSLL